MARIRTIKPEFPQSESMGRVSRDARLLFIMLWTIVDDSGITRGNSRMLASLLFPYDDDAGALISDWLVELDHEGCIVQYVVEGQTYLQICNWLNHQKIDKPSASKFPSFANIREDSRILPVGSRTKDQGSRTKDLDQDQGSEERKKPTAADAAFDAFWHTYPKKTGKTAALAAWKKAKPPLHLVLDALAWQCRSEQWLKDQGQFVPNPATYLNQGRWQDEPQNTQFIGLSEAGRVTAVAADKFLQGDE